MKKYTSLIVASILTIIVACSLFARISMQKQHFDKTVKEALKITEGYDQQFIDMVNRLEHELALRASFGYIGGKDPMTGKERIVVTQKAPPKSKPRNGTSTPATVAETAPSDSVRLTAIIYDDLKKLHTAIIMVGERSFAIDAGDVIIGRKVTTVNDSLVIMQQGSRTYIYDIAGNVEIK
jgi:hypothetical protein